MSAHLLLSSGGLSAAGPLSLQCQAKGGSEFAAHILVQCYVSFVCNSVQYYRIQDH